MKERARVLVVDDDPMILEALDTLLSDGWEVFCARSAARAAWTCCRGRRGTTPTRFESC